MSKVTNKPDEPVEGQILRRAFTSNVIKAIDEEKRTIEFIISTATADRYGDTIQVKGWDLKAYKQNPVVLFAHNSSIPPVGKSTKIWKDGDALRAIAEFMPADMSAFADSIFRMYLGQFLRATSVGFRPLQYEPIIDEETGQPTWSYNFLKQELLEFSCVPVPANPEALIQARQKGIDTTPIKQWAEEMLDNWKVHEKEVGNITGMNRKELELVRRRAAGAGMSIIVPPSLQDEIRQRNLEAIRKHKEEKAKVNTFETISIRGVDYDLPAHKGDGAGEISITTKVKGKKKTFNIDKADETALFSLDLLDSENDVINVELRAVEDGAQELFIDIKDAEKEVTYQVLGVTKDDAVFGVKVKELEIPDDLMEAIQDAEVVDLTEEDDEEKSVNGEDEETDDDTGVDDESGDVDDESDADEEDEETDDESDSDDNSDEGDDDVDDEKSADKAVTKAKGKGPKVVELSYSESLSFIETILCDFEDGLKDTKAASIHDVRKANFLAGYMRELADRLDGGKKGTEAKTTPSKKTEEEEHKFTPDEAQKYVADLVRNLQPALTELVTKKLAQARGRLD